MNNCITASRLIALQTCPRSHYWSYEVGLRASRSSQPLRFGSAWARGMEARWSGKSYSDALCYAVPAGVDLDVYDIESVASLLAGYYERYKQDETIYNAKPEVEFGPIPIDSEFYASGKIDAIICELSNGKLVKLEAKTTGDSLDEGSEYWLRLAYNMQILQYLCALRELGYDVAEVIYDVTRKPSIHPNTVDDVDENGDKIVVDSNGDRVLVKGKPRKTADKEKGWVVKQHKETPQEYSNRLYADVSKRPEFYFARKKVPFFDCQLEEFTAHRLVLIEMIRVYRKLESSTKKKENAWPRSVGRSCVSCQYKSFCLSSLSVSTENPPEGFSIIEKMNPELTTT